MSGSVNKVIIVGNCARDPEIRSIQSGGKVANLTVATSERWRDKGTNEQKEKSEFHRVSIFNDNIVGIVERFVKKGSKIYVEGSLQTRKWTDQQGQERYTTEINIGRFNGQLTLLDGRKDGGDAQPEQRQASPVSYSNTSTAVSYAALDDTIPF